MNPYLIPGLEDTPYAPLCPYRDEDHNEFYVPVDDTKNEFDRFTEMMQPVVGRLIDRGRLIAVAGKPGCGKTSLINRCAAWLRKELADAQLQGEIFCLTDSARLDQAIMLRMERVVTDLVDELRDEGQEVRSHHIGELDQRIREIEMIEKTADQQARHAAKVDRVYKYLHDVLPDGRIAIVLLPPSSELYNEIESYIEFARHRRVVFFAETDHVEPVEQMWQKVSMNERMPPILLKVGHLNPGDGWEYARRRQGRDSVEPGLPTVSQRTMQRVTEGSANSVAWLHRLLYGVYQELMSQKTLTGSFPFSKVSYHHIAEYGFRVTKPGNQS